MFFLAGIWTFDSKALHDCLFPFCSIPTCVSVGYVAEMEHTYFVFTLVYGTNFFNWIYRQPDLGFMKRLQQILGRKHKKNLHVSISFEGIIPFFFYWEYMNNTNLHRLYMYSTQHWDWEQLSWQCNCLLMGRYLWCSLSLTLVPLA